MAKKLCDLKGVIVYDNGGKTADRYTVFIKKDVFGMSKNPSHPQGFNQWAGDTSEIKKGKHLGKKIPVSKLPLAVKKAICERKL